MPISMSQSAISSQQLAAPGDHKQYASQEFVDDKYNEKYLDKYTNDSCKQMGLQIGLQPKPHSSQPFSAISEHESELSLPSPSPMPRPLQRHYSVVDPKSFGSDIVGRGGNVPAGRGGWPIGFESAIAGEYSMIFYFQTFSKFFQAF